MNYTMENKVDGMKRAPLRVVALRDRDAASLARTEIRITT